MIWPAALVLASCIFAAVAGSNDGASLVAGAIRVSGLDPAAAILAALGTLAAGPFFLGTAVSTTLASGLIPFGETTGVRAMLWAVLGAVVVVGTLSRAGLPTSLTLGFLGALAGVGWTGHLGVAWGRFALVLIVGTAAPGVAALGAYLLAKGPLRLLGSQQRARRLHFAAYGAECLAYSANGAQKMLAVASVALGGLSRSAGRQLGLEEAIVVPFFAVGVVAGTRRVSRRLTRGLVVVRLRHALVAEALAAGAGLVAGLSGIPLTMTQTTTAALMGASASESLRRIRWDSARSIALSWIVTLPASFLLAGALAALART